jgi:tellurite resistance protein
MKMTIWMTFLELFLEAAKPYIPDSLALRVTLAFTLKDIYGADSAEVAALTERMRQEKEENKPITNDELKIMVMGIKSNTKAANDLKTRVLGLGT